VNEDIKEIEKTLPKLRDFHETYAGLSSEADVLLDRIDQYSVSAISTGAVKTRTQEIQVHMSKSLYATFILLTGSVLRTSLS